MTDFLLVFYSNFRFVFNGGTLWSYEPFIPAESYSIAYRVGQKSKLLYYDRYFKGLQRPNVKYCIILCTVKDLNVGNTNSICVMFTILRYTLL